jgi:deoxyribose-phosphate aldolase
MTRSELASYIDHTVLKPDTLTPAIEKLCAEALEHQFAAVCVAPRWVPLSAKILKDSEIHVCTVVGFPHGDTLSKAKAHETKAAIEAGATEVDMVISMAAALEGDWKYIYNDIAAVVAAAHGHAIIKVIFENAYLNRDQIVACCRAAVDAGADYVKTSTGFAASGATIEDVRLMRESVGEGMGVKAAGGIRDLATAMAMIDAGASRLGCSASIAILNELGAA